MRPIEQDRRPSLRSASWREHVPASHASTDQVSPQFIRRKTGPARQSRSGLTKPLCAVGVRIGCRASCLDMSRSQRTRREPCAPNRQGDAPRNSKGEVCAAVTARRPDHCRFRWRVALRNRGKAAFVRWHAASSSLILAVAQLGTWCSGITPA